MIFGGYVLDLYCDGKDCKHGKYGREPSFGQYTNDETGAQARQRARKAGWRIDTGSYKTLCPSCVAAGNTYHED